MSDQAHINDDPVLEQADCELLGAELAAAQMPADAVARLRARVLDGVDKLRAAAPPPSLGPGFVTTFADDDEGWEELTPLLHRKLLHEEAGTGARSYLLRAKPGGAAPAHEHLGDEICLVLQGEIDIHGMKLRAGDYHFAPKDSAHGEITTNTGALVYIRDA